MFEKLSPAVANLGLRLVQRRGVAPGLMLREFNDPGLVLEDLCGPEWPQEEIRYYALRAGEEATRALSALQEVESPTHDDRWGAFLAAQALRCESRGYMNPDTGRIGHSIGQILHWFGHLKVDLAVAESRGWFNSNEPALEIIRCQMFRWEESLAGVYDLIFAGHNGRPSIGWFSAGERDAGLASLKGLTSEAMRQQVQTLWESHGGLSAEFARRWSKFVDVTNNWRRRFQKVAAPLNASPHGRAAIEDYLHGWGITSTIEQLLEVLDAEVITAQQEATRLRHGLRAPWMPDSNAQVIDRAERLKERFAEHLRRTGVTVDLSDVIVRVLSEDQAGSGTLASADAGGHSIILSPATRTENWTANGVLFDQIVAHELTHCFQMRQQVIPGGFMSDLAREGTSQAAEEWWMLESGPTRGVMCRLLEREHASALFTASCWRFHLGQLSEQELIRRIMSISTGMSHERATKTAVTLTGSVSHRPMYWLASRFIDAARNDCHLSAQYVFPRLASGTGLILPGHALIPGVDPFHFDLATHLTDTTTRVHLARTLFP